jgi:hypothetical protein
MLLVHPNIKVINKLVRPRVAQLCRNVSLFQKLLTGSLCPESSGLITLFGWLSFTGTAAHFTPEWWLSMLRIIHTLAAGSLHTPAVQTSVTSNSYAGSLQLP